MIRYDSITIVVILCAWRPHRAAHFWTYRSKNMNWLLDGCILNLRKTAGGNPVETPVWTGARTGGREDQDADLQKSGANGPWSGRFRRLPCGGGRGPERGKRRAAGERAGLRGEVRMHDSQRRRRVLGGGRQGDSRRYAAQAGVRQG